MFAKLTTPCLALFVISCGGEHFLQTEQYSTLTGEREEYVGGSCLRAAPGNGQVNGIAPGASKDEAAAMPMYSYQYKGGDDVIDFTISDGDGHELASRHYDLNFLDSGARDEVSLSVDGGELRFVNRGVDKCEPVRVPTPAD